MCGIAGSLNFKYPDAQRENLRAMCGTLTHRGPDGSGFFDAPGISLGHRRLAVIDLVSGAQPLYSEDRQLVLVLNGEIYNCKELRRELEAKGHRFATNSDSEAVLHLFEEESISAFERLDGMFALALYDCRMQKLLLARDRMGKKPLFYFKTRQEFVFASELGALKMHPAFPSEYDLKSVSAFFSLQYVPGVQTIYRSVFRVPPGSYMLIDRKSGKTESCRFWRPDYRKQLDVPMEEFAGMLRKLIFSAVEKRLMSDVPFGVFLSGGIDSAIIAGVTAKLLNGKPCDAFTIGFDELRYDERKAAAVAANAINRFASGNLRCHERVVNPADFDSVVQLLKNFGEPYADASMIPTALLSAFAKEKITVALSGDGADELFGGYERYRAMAMAQSFQRVPKMLRTMISTGAALLPDRGERSFTGRLRRLTRTLSDDSPDRYFHLLDRCPQELRKKLFGSAFEEAALFDPAELFQRELLTSSRIPECFSELDLLTYLPGDILPKVDIASMNFALEVRAPFLDRKVVDFAGMLPWKYKQSGSGRKILLKHAFADLLPRELCALPKRGFGVPVASLLRGAWKTRTEELIFEGKAVEWQMLNGKTLAELWKRHQSGRADFSYLLWNAVIFNLFLEEEQR